jgi:uncharacterized protein involved in response to NO
MPARPGADEPTRNLRLGHRPGRVPADRLFFPAAAGYALAAVPLWAAALSGWVKPLPPYWHAHELVFGYALLVVAGYLLGRASLGLLALLLATWLAARVAAWLVVPGDIVAAAPQLAFSFTVTATVAWPFLRAAKKVQNAVFGPLIIALFLCDAAYQYAAAEGRIATQGVALLIAVDLYVLLLLLMGGRVIPAAVGGHYYRQGAVLEARVQPALEKAAIAAMVAMIALDLVPGAQTWAGACALVAALVTAVRAYRWRLWTVLREPTLWTLGLAYLWLVPGLALKGWAQALPGPPLGVVLHVLTIGALGTMTLVMMARTRLQRSKLPLTDFGSVAAASLLLAAATLTRLWSAALEEPLRMLWISAILWTAAFAVLLHLMLSRRQERA